MLNLSEYSNVLQCVGQLWDYVGLTVITVQCGLAALRPQLHVTLTVMVSIWLLRSKAGEA